MVEEEEEAPGVVEGPEEAPEDMVMAQGETPEDMPRIPVDRYGIRVSGSPGLTSSPGPGCLFLFCFFFQFFPLIFLLAIIFV